MVARRFLTLRSRTSHGSIPPHSSHLVSSLSPAIPVSAENKPDEPPSAEFRSSSMSSTALETPGTTEPVGTRAWWGDRGVKVKVLAAVGGTAVVAGVIGVLGLSGMSQA